MGDGLLAAARRPRPRGHARDRTAPRTRGRSARPGATRATCREVDLDGVDATTIDEAPVADAELVVVAVPSRAFRSVVEALPGDAPVLGLTKGLDPETGERLSTLVRGRPVAVLSGPNMAEEVAAGPARARR